VETVAPLHEVQAAAAHADLQSSARDNVQAAAEITHASPNGPPLGTPAAGPHESVSADLTTLLELLRNFRRQVGSPLLSLPDPKVVRRRLFCRARPSTRKSKRISDLRHGASTSTVKKAQRMLMEKLGICQDQQRLSAAQLQEYTAMFASLLGKEQVTALTALFGLSCSAADEVDLVAVAAV
jgi:hypothetical protein